MVLDLLDYAQIKGNKFRKRVKAFNIREAIGQTLMIHEAKA
jgi:hypothetical protein